MTARGDRLVGAGHCAAGFLLARPGEGSKCVVCKGGETRPDSIAVTLVRETTTLVFKAVPAEICALTGQSFLIFRLY